MDEIDALIIWMEKQAEQMEAEASNHMYLLRKETCEKLSAIRSAFSNQINTTKSTFDAIANTICVEIRDYVFDSYYSDLQKAFTLADTIVIDSLTNGLICISLIIQNAADKLS